MKQLVAALVVFTCVVMTAKAQLNQVQQMPLSGAPTPSPTPAPFVGQNLPAAAELPAGFPVNSRPQSEPPAQAQLPPYQQQNQAPPVASPRADRFAPSEVIPILPPIAKVSELRAVLRTSVGDITIKLDRVNAPATVSHFVGLARGEKEFIDVKTSKPVKRPFYNGLIFHRAVKGTLIQTGCPFGNGRGGPGSIANVGDEVKASMKFARPGMVAMAPMRDAAGMTTLKNSNGSQFFITLKEMPEWAGQFTVFGEVEDGMDVVQKIANSKVGPTERPIKRIYLVAVEIIEQ